MTDQNTPLSDEERAELEALRAEKARREEEERARKERAELEALRAEQAAADAPASQKPAAAPKPRRAPAPQEPAIDPENLTFGQKMVMTKDEVDEDGVPPMPPAQRLIIAVGVVLLIVAGFWLVKNNLH